MTHFLQSPAWTAFQQSLGRTTISRGGDGWSYQAILEHGKNNSRLYTPYGPTLDAPSAFEPAVLSLINEAKQHNATFIRIEPTANTPTSLLRNRGFRKVHHVQPENTWCIDLTQNEDNIIAAMQQNNRNLHRNYVKKGLSIHTSQNPEDISILTSLLHDVASTTGMTPHSDNYFKTQAAALFPVDAATLYYAVFEGKPIAAALVYDSGTTRYYAHAAADYDHRKLGAGTALVSHMIIDAKKKDLITFDFYGITPSDNPSHPWYGFTKFKKSFGGYPVDYVGTWELGVNKWRYSLYRIAKTLAHLK